MTIDPKNFPHIQDLDLPVEHRFYKTIVFDTDKQEYYNKKSDMYLTEEDMKYLDIPPPESLPGYVKTKNDN